MRKTIGLMLIAIIALSSLMIIKPVNSQITKPSVPEFSIKLVDNSYDVPTTYTTDPYTGVTVTNPSHHVTNRTVELVVKNQQFSSKSVEGWNISLFYNVRMKGHFGQEWQTLYNPTVTPMYAQENSENTVISFAEFASDAIIDFQVQALAGYVHRIANGSATNILDMYPWVFDGEASDWSNTQTLTMSEYTISPTPFTSIYSGSPNPTLTIDQSSSGGSVIFGLDLLGVTVVAMLGAIIVLLVFVVFYLRKRSIGGIK
jgi:hypothetical protein